MMGAKECVDERKKKKHEKHSGRRERERERKTMHTLLAFFSFSLLFFLRLLISIRELQLQMKIAGVLAHDFAGGVLLFRAHRNIESASCKHLLFDCYKRR